MTRLAISCWWKIKYWWWKGQHTLFSWKFKKQAIISTFQKFFTLGMSGHIKDERQYQFLDKCDTRLHKKINLFPHFFLEILQRVYKFVILGNMVRHGLASTCRRVRCLSVCKKSTPSLPSFWDIAKILQTCYFWVLRACLASLYYITKRNILWKNFAKTVT